MYYHKPVAVLCFIEYFVFLDVNKFDAKNEKRRK